MAFPTLSGIIEHIAGTKAKASEVNANNDLVQNFADLAKAWADDLALDDLDAVTAGQVPVGNGSGVLTARTLAGPVTVDSSGNTAISYVQDDQDSDATHAAAGTSITCGVTLGSGTWLVWGKQRCEPLSASDDTQVKLVNGGGTVFDQSRHIGSWNTLPVGPEVVPGGDTYAITASISLGGTCKYGRIAAIRIA